MWETLVNGMIRLLEGLYLFTGSWGIAIILLTLLVRLITHPLNKKQMDSMQKMQRLQPQIKILQEKFKNDREALSKETMQLYRDSKVNPVAGCLPLLVQLPIFILLFQALSNLVSEAEFSATFFEIGLGESVYSTIIAACHATITMALPAAGFTEEIIKNLAITTGYAEEVLRNLVGAEGFTEETIKYLANTTGLMEKVVRFVINTTGYSEEVMRNLTSITGLSPEVIRGLTVLRNADIWHIGIFNVGYAVLNNPAGLLNFNYYMANSILLIVMGFLTWYQQKLMSTGNPQMAMMVIIMPIVLTWICLGIPGGVLLYWGGNSLIAVVQQIYTSKQTKKEMDEKPILYKDKPKDKSVEN